MRRAALPCRRHRRALLLVPCVAGLLAAFVVTPSPAAQKTAPSQQPKLWALGVSAGKVPSVKVAKLQWLRRRGIQALVVNASALSPKQLAKLTDRAAHSGMLVIAARGSLRPGACQGSSSTLRTCAVIAQTPRKAVRLTRLNSFDYVVYYVHDLRQVNYLRGVKATHTQLLAIVPPRLVRADTRRWKSVAANASSDSALNLTIRTAPAASPPVMGLLDLFKRWRPRLVPPRKSPAPAPPPVTNAATTTPVTTDPPPTTTTPPPTTTTPPPTTTTPPPTTTTPPPTTTTPPPTTTTPPPTTTTPPPTTTTPPPTTTTPPPTTTTGDTQPPSAPQGLAVTGSSQTSISVSWNPSTDNVGVSGYDLYRNGTSIGTTSATSRTFSSLTCGTSYTLGVDAYDAAGNKSAASSITASTAACPDTQPPTTPTGLLVTGSTATSISISWNASFDNVSVSGYDAYLGSTLAGTTTTFTIYTFSGLTCGTSYTVAVDAFDPSGNKSGKASVTTSTAPCADTTKPSTPTGLTVTGSTSTSISLSWTASTDNVGVAGYQLSQNGSQVGSSTSTSYSFTGLTCGTSYSLGVTAYDAAGNLSGTATVSQATSACSTPSVSGQVYMSPSGNDSTCVRGNAAKPCATLAGAYKVAQSGDTVLVAPGSYSMAGSQVIPYDSSKTNSTLTSPCHDSARVTFQSSGPIQSYGASGDPLFTVPTHSGDGLTIHATCLTFNGLDFDAEINIPANDGTSDNVSSLTFENGRYDHNRGYPAGEAAWNVNANYVTFKNIEVGPICCDNDAMDLIGAPTGVDYGLTMDNVYMHDILGNGDGRNNCADLTVPSNWPNCSSESTPYAGNHTDCIQTLGMGDWTVENSRILNCNGGGGAALQSGVYWANNAYFNVLWQNNVIDTTTAGIGCGGPCETTYGNSYAFKATVPSGYPDSGTKSYFKVLNNTMQFGLTDSDFQPGGDYELVGNTMDDAGNGTGCQLSQAAVWSNASNNVFTDPSYGSQVASACNQYGTNNTSH